MKHFCITIFLTLLLNNIVHSQILNSAGIRNGDRNEIYWSTYPELNNNCFLIEESVTGNNWKTQYIINANDYANIIENYSLIIETSSVKKYYRITQFEFIEFQHKFYITSIDVKLINNKLCVLIINVYGVQTVSEVKDQTIVKIEACY